MAGQQGDVSLFQTNDGGEITVEGGIVTMSGGLETSAYLSLFGGNEDDDGRADNPFNWWANISEVETAKQYRSETQNLLQALPATTGNLRRVEDAANRDLAWFITERVASAVNVTASMPGLNKLKLTIDIEALGADADFEFVENWKAGS